VPTLLLQGRRDFLFDMDQAIASYKLLTGPKKLYLGDLGHPPATNPPDELPTYVAEAVSWFRHYLAGSGSVGGGGVELAHDPWDGTTTSYEGLPGTRRVSVNFPGTSSLGSGASATRRVRLPGGPLETFGDGYITLRYSARRSWARLSASVSLEGSSTPLTFGAVRPKKTAGVIRIPLSDQSVLIPRGKRLVVSVGGSSAGGVYTGTCCAASPTITIGRVTLTLSLLKHTVSK
jgi:hypothetical protein